MSGLSLVVGRSRHVALTLVLCAITACSDSPSGPGRPEATFLAFTSEPEEFIGEGKTKRFTLSDGQWQVQPWTSDVGVFGVSVRLVTSQERWNLEIVAPTGRRLEVGTYEGTYSTHLVSSDTPGLNLSGNTRRCSPRGRFVVHELVLGPENTVDRLHVTFEQFCNGVPPGLEGELAIVANPWR